MDGPGGSLLLRDCSVLCTSRGCSSVTIMSMSLYRIVRLAAETCSLSLPTKSVTIYIINRNCKIKGVTIFLNRNCLLIGILSHKDSQVFNTGRHENNMIAVVDLCVVLDLIECRDAVSLQTANC